MHPQNPLLRSASGFGPKNPPRDPPPAYFHLCVSLLQFKMKSCTKSYKVKISLTFGGRFDIRKCYESSGFVAKFELLVCC